MLWRAAALLLCALASPAAAQPLFGYVGILCEHDDPHDAAPLTDYSAEVADFTTANHVCLSGDRDVLVDRLRRAADLFVPILHVEAAFFETGPDGTLRPAAAADELWRYTVSAIGESGILPSDIIFYLVDEPTLRGLDLAAVTAAATTVHGAFPGARTMIVEAATSPVLPPVPDGIDLWGFDLYAVPDPATDPAYLALIADAVAAIGPDRGLVIAMDAQYTPVHWAAGLAPEDMADVARSYLRLAQATPQVALMLGYTWAGGIDGLHERGVRDLPPVVAEAHREMGRALGR